MSLVLELQRKAINGTESITNLLRMALMVSKKLKVNEFEQWLNQEINGYSNNKDIPEYRAVCGDVKVFNPYRGYIPLIVEDSETADYLTRQKVNLSIAEVEHLLSQSKGILTMSFSTKTANYIMSYQDVPMEPSLHIPDSQFYKIVETVRIIILSWSLQLEADGVLGEGMSFSKKDEETAAKSTAQIITNNNIFNSSGGNVQLQQHTESSSQTNTMNTSLKMSDISQLIEDLKKMSKEVQDVEQKEILETDIGMLELQVKSPKPKLNVIVETLRSVRNISEGITGSLIASSIQEKVTSLLGQIIP
ncbi:hypothetical protein [Brevibacillus porteri]|uniref:AbiTii domain-containing protein n=1 Tax=Brevibacillus porteri TaxID=2126350 RepID=UPI00363DF8BC